ncbi:MAG: winged helix-turn-helix transcriptional regulator [Candidatus Bathyarchaeota archaeon]
MSHAISKAKSLILEKERKTGKQMIYAISKAKSFIIRKEKVERDKSLLVRKESVEMPYKSKLMICIEVLCTLVSNGPMKLTQLREKFEMDESRLKPHLRLLWNRGLVEEENFGDNTIYYVVTERGLKVLKVVSPLIREAQKIQMRDFEIISNTLSEAGYS